MGRIELTFNAVDDLTGAFQQDMLARLPADLSFVPKRVGPLIELAFQSSEGRVGPLLKSQWLVDSDLCGFRAALGSDRDDWFDNESNVGFQRTTYSPLDAKFDGPRTHFLLSASRAAQRAGFSKAVAQRLAAAIREMEGNIHEHSECSDTGILAFCARSNSFEFAVADCGVGVLSSLKKASDFVGLNDHGAALKEALSEGASRYGREARRGMGFHDLFIGLATINGDLRFRSGDHALTISGAHPDLKTARLAQKPLFQGFLASVECTLPQGPRAHR